MSSATALQLLPAWEAARTAFLRTADPAQAQAAIAAATDAVVTEAFHASMPRGAPATLLALGAYGRRRPYPHSSVELLLVCSSDGELADLQPLLPGFTQRLWERGLSLRCAARTIAAALEPKARELQVLLGLLDRRLLGGDRTRLERLEGELPAALGRLGPRLRQELAQAVRARHDRYRNTPHHHIPDAKEGPGGLMDLHALRLLHLLRGGEAAAELPAELFFARVRCYLHFRAGRNCNLVDETARAELARPPFVPAAETARDWMRGYYAQARAVLAALRPELESAERVSGSLLGSYHDYRAHLSNADFTVARNRLLLRHPAQFAADPEQMIQALMFAGRHGVELAADTASRLLAARPVLEGYLERRGARWAVLRDLLPLPRAEVALRALHGLGLLGLLLPGWEAMEGLPAETPEARFTADEEALQCFAALARLRSPLRDDADPLRRRFEALLGECEQPAELSLAVLLQAMPADQARGAVAALAAPEDSRRRMEFLLAHRAGLEAALSARDLGDGEQARALAALAGAIEQLQPLVLLTYSHVAGGEAAWKEWRLEQLWQAYAAARGVLTRGLESDRIEQAPAELLGRAEFIRGFPARYLRVHGHADLEMHLRLEAESRTTGVAVNLEPTLAAFRLTVIARDRPGLFASFAAALASFGMNILKAEAFANRNGAILDTFVFADPNGMLQQNPPEAERLTDLFRRVALGQTDAPRLMRSVAAPAPSAARRARAEVRFEDEPAGRATLVEVRAEDRQGLLYSLASTLSQSGCDIHVVLIDTKGHQAHDVFYVACQGKPLGEKLRTQLAAKLREAC